MGKARLLQQSDWATEQSRVFGRTDDAKVAEAVAVVVRTPEPERSQRAPNAYSDHQARELLGLVRPTNRPSLPEMHSLLNRFAAYVGALIRSERPVDIKERVKLLKRVQKKAKTLLAELENDDLARECWTPGAPLSEYRLLKGQSATRNLISYAEDHLERLKTIGGKGKAWHTELRRHHIHMTALFCAFLNRGFRPSRVNDKEGEYGVLLDVVRVLAEPLFEPEPPDAHRPRNWRGMVREYVDELNAEAKKKR